LVSAFFLVTRRLLSHIWVEKQKPNPCPMSMHGLLLRSYIDYKRHIQNELVNSKESESWRIWMGK
jgi:hypothetical protein